MTKSCVSPCCTRIFLLATGFLFCTIISAQKHQLKLSFAPMAMVDEFSFPTVLMGLEYNIRDSVTILSEFGIRYRHSSFDRDFDTSFVHSGGFKWKEEVRFYNWQHLFAHPPSLAKGSYIGFNVFYTREAHNNSLTYVNYRQPPDVWSPPPADDHLKDNFGARKSVLGFNFLVGKQQTNFCNWLYVDLYAGFGWRWRFKSTVGQDFDAEHQQRITARHPNVFDMRVSHDLKTGNSIAFNVTAGIRLVFPF